MLPLSGLCCNSATLVSFVQSGLGSAAATANSLVLMGGPKEAWALEAEREIMLLLLLLLMLSLLLF